MADPTASISRKNYVVRMPDGKEYRFKASRQITRDALLQLTGLRVVAVVSDTNGRFELTDAPQFPEGAYTAVLASDRQAAVADKDIVRAHECLVALRSADATTHLATLLRDGVHFDISHVAVTAPFAKLRYMIALGTESVVVAIDAAAHLPTFLKGASHEDIHEAIASLAALLPMQTLLELTTIPEADLRLGGAESSSDEAPAPRVRALIFTGHDIAGAVAHVAAIHARQRRVVGDAVVAAVAFAAPHCVAPAVADSMLQSGDAAYHVTIVEGGDVCVDIENAVAAVSRAQLPEMRDFVALAERVLTGPPDRALPTSDARTLTTGLTTWRDAVQRGPQGSPCLAPLGFFHVIRGGRIDTLSHEEDIARALAAPAEGVTSAGVRMHGNLPWSPALQAKAAFPASAAPPGIMLLPLTPILASCSVVETPAHTELVLKGQGLEPLLGRLARDATPLPLPHATPATAVVFADDVSKGREVVRVAVPRAGSTDARVLLLNAASLSGRKMKAATDFGVSNEVVIGAVLSADDVAPVAQDQSSIDAAWLRTVFLRALLPALRIHSRTASKAPPKAGVVELSAGEQRAQEEAAAESAAHGEEMLRQLCELECMVLGTEVSQIAQIMTEYRAHDPTHVFYALPKVNSILEQMVASLSTTFTIVCHTPLQRFARKALGSVGQVVGSVLALVGAVALLPAGLLALPSYYFFHRERNVAGGIAAVPAAIAALPGILVAGSGRYLLQASTRLKVDPVTMAYTEVLRLFWAMFNTRDFAVLEEVTVLERAIADAFAERSGGKQLASATRADVHRVLEELSRAPGDPPAALYRRALPSSRDNMLRWLLVIGRAMMLRRAVLSHVVIAFIGVHNSGKSTSISRLFGINTGADVLRRTIVPELHTLTTIGDADALRPIESERPPRQDTPHPSASNFSNLNHSAAAAAAAAAAEDDGAAAAAGAGRPMRLGSEDVRELLPAPPTAAAMLEDTMTPAAEQLFFNSRDHRMRLEVLDLPGMTDENAHVAGMADRVSSAVSLYVCVFAAGHIAKPEQDIMRTVLATQRDYVVLINKCDVLGDELDRRKAEFAENYARVLGVPQDKLFFVTMRSEQSIEQVRCVLYTYLRAYLGSYASDELALAMLHPTQRTELLAKAAELGAPSDVVARLVDSALSNFKTCTPEAVDEAVNEARRRRMKRAAGKPAPLQLSSSNRSHVHQLLVELLTSMGLSADALEATVAVCVGTATPADPAKPPAEDDVDPLHAMDAAQVLFAVKERGEMDLLALVPMMEVARRVDLLYAVLRMRGHESRPVIDAIVACFLARTPNVDAVDAKLRSMALAAGPAAPVAQAAPIISLRDGMLAVRGQEVAQLVRRGTCVSIVASHIKPINPKTVYPTFDPSMDLQARAELFHAAVTPLHDSAVGMTVASTHLVETLVDLVMSIPPEHRSAPWRFRVVEGEGIDAGGVARGIMTQFARELAEGKCRFFDALPNRAIYFGLSGADAAAGKAAAQYFRAVGRIIGMALRVSGTGSRLPVPLPLHPAAFKLLLLQPLDWDDLASMRPEVANSIRSMCEMDPEEISSLDLVFTLGLPGGAEIELVRGGADTPVDGNNRPQYLRELACAYLGAHLPLRAFVLGVQDMLPRALDLLSIFTPAMIQTMLCGVQTYTAADMAAATQWVTRDAVPDELKQWFWEAVEAMSDDDRALLLAFITGSSVLPPGGFASMQRLTVVYDRGATVDGLPTAHTCMFALVLPRYTSSDTLRARLAYAIRNTRADEFSMA